MYHHHSSYFQVFFEIIVDGKSEKNVNTKPTLYKNVKVWAAAPERDYYPTANARIKNLEYNQKGEWHIC